MSTRKMNKMIEFMKEDMLPKEVLKSKILQLFNLLRFENVRSNEFHIILFLLSAYRDNLITKDLIGNNEARELLIGRLHLQNNDFWVNNSTIFRIFEPAMIRLSQNGINELIRTLSELDKKVLNDNYSEIFDFVLDKISQSQGRYADESIQPIELTQLMCELANLKKDAKVFNPFAGLASFGIYLNNYSNYFAQELNPKTAVLGSMRLKAYGKSDNSKYTCDHSIINWPDRSEQFDLIITNPPMGLRLGNQFHDIEPNFNTIEQFLVEKSLQSLKPNGKMIALFSQNFLSSGSYNYRLRERLIDEDLIETIISLPGGILPNTNVSSVIFVLSKAKKYANKVQFVDASKYIISKGPREKILSNISLINLIHSNNSDNDVIRIVDNEQIRNNDFNLSVPRYFKKEIDGIKLGELLQIIRGQRINLPETGKLVRIRDLKDDNLDFKLDISTVPTTELTRPDFLVKESCLLLALRWRNLKPTFFEYDGIPIIRSLDILSFKVDESKVDVAYLINELDSEYVQEQINSYRISTVMPYIRSEDLMEVVIKLPSIKEQKAKVEGLNELSVKINHLQKERDNLVHGNKLNKFNEFASLKHTLGRPRQNILDWSDNLLDFLSKNEFALEKLNSAFSEFYETDIISAVKEIKHDINFITEVLEKGENGLILSEYPKNVIPLAEIKGIINGLSNNGYNFKLKKIQFESDLESDSEIDNLNQRGIYANKTLFITLMDNLLTNANKYAFDQKAEGNEVVIKLSELDNLLHLEIKNNGKPFPKNFDREKFITKYSTADSQNGSGLGGYDIHRIACDFNNPDWTLNLSEDPFFAVKFNFQFSIIPIA